MKKRRFRFKARVEEMSARQVRRQQQRVKKLKMPEIRTMDFLYEGEEEITYEYPELIALCPMTGVPDIYTVRVTYVPDKKVPELKSLRFYFLGYKDVPILHEHLASKIFQDLESAIKPVRLKIELDAAVRGGFRTKIVRETGE